MKVNLFFRQIICALLFVLISPRITIGHHSVAAGFDMSEETIVSGTVTGIEWINPHARVFLSVVNSDNQTETWTAWLSGANMLLRRGWGSDDIAIGESISVDGFRARNGSNEMYGGKIRLSDGRVLFSGNPAEER